MNCLAELPELWLNRLMTLLRARRERLMFWPSRRRMPSAWVLLAPSDPAKSTRFNCEILVLVPPDFSAESPSWSWSWASWDLMLSLKTVWLLELCSFSLVAAMLRDSSPLAIKAMTSWTDSTLFSLSRLMYTPDEMLSLISRFLFDGSIRSFTLSLYISIYETEISNALPCCALT